MKPLRQVLTVSFVFLLSLNSYSQSIASLTGQVLDKTDHQGLSSATVEFYQNEVFITGVHTDFDGNFGVAGLVPGEYEVIVSYLGYKVENKTIEIFGKKEETFRLQEGIFIDEIVIISYDCHQQIGCLWGCHNIVKAEEVKEESEEEEAIKKETVEVIQETIFYPNPSSGPVNFKSEEVIKEIELRDMMGKLIWTKQLESKQGNIDLSEMQTGYYILRYGSMGVYKTKRLVKIAC